MGREALNESWSRTWIARALASIMDVWGGLSSIRIAVRGVEP